MNRRKARFSNALLFPLLWEGLPCHLSRGDEMKTISLSRTHTYTEKLFTFGCRAPMFETEDRACLHFSCTCLSALLTQMYCKEIASQIGMHVHVRVARGWKNKEGKDHIILFAILFSSTSKHLSDTLNTFGKHFLILHPGVFAANSVSSSADETLNQA